MFHEHTPSRPRALLTALGLSLTILISGCINDSGGGFSAPGGDESGSSGTSGNGQVTLSWERPESREDGTTFMASEVDTYEVAYGSSSGDYTETLETSNTSARINSLPVGETYYFTVRIRDTNGLTSDYAPEVQAEVND